MKKGALDAGIVFLYVLLALLTRSLKESTLLSATFVKKGDSLPALRPAQIELSFMTLKGKERGNEIRHSR